jgi:hypothetical protein
MKALLLRTQEGDWEGLYIGDKLIDEGHRLGEGSPESFWLDISLNYGITSADLTILELTDEDNAETTDSGCFPPELVQLTGNYRH